MAEHSVPIIRRLQLGRELRYWRNQSGLTLDQCVADLDISRATLSRYEHGQGILHPLHVRAMAELYNVPVDDTDRLMTLARQARRPQPLVEGLTGDSYPALESEAVAVRNFELIFIPGLLQTESYATALFSLNSTRERNRNLAVRMARRRRLFADDPLRLHTIIDESALIRPIGDAETMTEQLRHVVEMSRLPTIHVQVLPMSLGPTVGLRGPFNLLTFPPDTIGDLGYIDHAAGSVKVPKTDMVANLVYSFDRLAKLALSEKQSVELIERLIDDS